MYDLKEEMAGPLTYTHNFELWALAGQAELGTRAGVAVSQ